MALVKKYVTEVISIESTIDGVFTLELKSLSKPFRYYPGQFLHFALDEYDPSGNWPESRCFSMQTPPQGDTLKITYAAKGPFTNRMAESLTVGSKATLKLPYGDLFTQNHNKAQTVFIAGGTGITPFLSLFNDDSFSGYENPVLYAGFRNIGMNLYQKELDNAAEINSNLKINCVYQDEAGVLPIDKILALSDKSASFFISGPPVMIRSFKEFLLRHGIPECQVKTDDWE